MSSDRNLLHSSFAMNVSLSAPGPLDVASTLSRRRGDDPVNRLRTGDVAESSGRGEHQNMAIHDPLAGQRLAAPTTGGGA